MAYSSRLFQIHKGENKARIEIKYDDLLVKTGNLWIEVEEKANSENRSYVASGIQRDCVEYVIGNYDILFRLATSTLRLLFQNKRYPLIENGTKTSRGFLLPASAARKLAIDVIETNCEGEMRQLIDSQNSINGTEIQDHIRSLLRSIKCDPNQIVLFDQEGGTL